MKVMVYRDYSENDVENIKKIAYLRTLGIPIEDIRSIISEKVTLRETLEKQNEVLKRQLIDLNKAKTHVRKKCWMKKILVMKNYR